jgi:endoglucanase
MGKLSGSLTFAVSAVVATFLAGCGSSTSANQALTATPSLASAIRPQTNGPTRVPVTSTPHRWRTSDRTVVRKLRGLHVQGVHIVDGHGRPLRLLGVNRSGSEFKCIQLGTATSLGWGIFDGPLNAASARSIAAWHVNVVRIPLNEDCWLGINGVNPQYGGTSYRNVVQRYVHTLHRAGLYVILDLHWSAPGKFPATSQQPMPDLDHAPAFWRSVATRFKHDPYVAFDLYNEPFLYTSYLDDPTEDFWYCWRQGCTLNQYLTGGHPFTKAYEWKTAGMQTLVNVIRASGASNMILVAGLDWANDVSKWLQTAPSDPDHNIAVSWHSYPGEICGQETCWSHVVASLARSIPVVVGETGDNVCTAPSYDPTFLPWADRHGLSYLGWTWNTWQDCKNILIKNYSGTPTSNYGEYFYQHLASLATLRRSWLLPARPAG